MRIPRPITWGFLLLSLVGCSANGGVSPSHAPIQEGNGSHHSMTTVVSGNMTAYVIAGSTPAGPSFVSFTNDGELWFSQESNAQVGRLTISGTQSYPVNQTGPTQPAPTGMLVGTDGNIWFAEYNGSAIAKFDPCSHTVTRYPTNVGGSTPWGLIQGPDGAMWFVDPGANKIGRIDYAGNVQEFPVGSQYGSNPIPAYITAGPDGNLWFTEYGIGAIGVFSPSSHTLLREYSSDDPGNPIGPHPNDIIVGPDNNIWWVNSGLSKLDSISPAAPASQNPTEYTLFSSGTHFIANLAKGSDGNLWMSDSYGALVVSYSTSGQNVATYDMNSLGLPRSGFGCGPGQNGCTPSTLVSNSPYPYGLSSGPDGRMYVALYNANAVVAIKP